MLLMKLHDPDPAVAEVGVRITVLEVADSGRWMETAEAERADLTESYFKYLELVA